MFTTPLRSENMPPMRRKGQRSRPDSVEGQEGRPHDDLVEVADVGRVESSPSAMPTRPAASLPSGAADVAGDRPDPGCDRAEAHEHRPPWTARLTGGIVSQKAKRPGTIPPIAIAAWSESRRLCRTAFTWNLLPPGRTGSRSFRRACQI